MVREGFHNSLIEFVVTAPNDSQTVQDFADDSFTVAGADELFFVGLSHDPLPGSVSVTRNGAALTPADSAGMGGDYKVIGNKVLFVDNTGVEIKQSGQIDVTYDYEVPGFADAITKPVLVRLNDDDAPTVLVRESGGSTDVIEGAPSLLTISFSGQPFAADSLAGKIIKIIGGAGAGQTAEIVGNSGNTITIEHVWTTVPDNTSTFNVSDPALKGISVPGAIPSALSVPGERDTYQVFLVAGASYTFNLEGAATSQGNLSDPYLRLFNSGNAQVAFNDDGGTGLNSRLTFTPSVTGSYFLSAGAYADRGVGTYRLSTSVSGEIANTTGTAASLFVPGSGSSEINPGTDADWFRVELSAGNTYTFDLEGAATSQGSLSDPYLRLFDSGSAQVASNDDGGTGLNTRIVFTPLTTGAYYLSAESYQNQQMNITGSYVLSAAVTPTQLQVASAAVATLANDTYELVLTSPPTAPRSFEITLASGNVTGNPVQVRNELTSDIKSYAVTSESLNFFVDESDSVDVMFVHDEDRLRKRRRARS